MDMGHFVVPSARNSSVRHASPAISVADAQTAIQETQQPRRPNEQKLNVIEKRWLLALDPVANELADPGDDEDYRRGKQHAIAEQRQGVDHQRDDSDHYYRQRQREPHVEKHRQTDRDIAHDRRYRPE